MSSPDFDFVYIPDRFLTRWSHWPREQERVALYILTWAKKGGGIATVADSVVMAKCKVGRSTVQRARNMLCAEEDIDVTTGHCDSNGQNIPTTYDLRKLLRRPAGATVEAEHIEEHKPQTAKAPAAAAPSLYPKTPANDTKAAAADATDDDAWQLFQQARAGYPQQQVGKEELDFASFCKVPAADRADCARACAKFGREVKKRRGEWRKKVPWFSTFVEDAAKWGKYAGPDVADEPEPPEETPKQDVKVGHARHTGTENYGPLGRQEI